MHYKNKLLAIGGRVYGGDDVSLLKKCEYFDLELGKWFEMPSMNIERCTCLSFIYKEQLWVVGGYTAYLKRSSMIEKFDFRENKWTTLSFRLS